MIKQKNIIQNIELKIAEFCFYVIQNPLVYFSESDLQQLITEKLRKKTQLLKKTILIGL